MAPDASSPHATDAAPPSSAAEQRVNVLLTYEVAGDLRFLAHHDELRMLQRALVRAAWPLAYSRGFNPRPKLTVLLPRNLGCAAVEQTARASLAEPRSPEALFSSLSRQMPAACPLGRVIAPAAGATPHPRQVAYELELEPKDLDGLSQRTAEILGAPTLVVDRVSAPSQPTRPLDIRPYINKLELRKNVLHMELLFVEQRTARPAEIIAALGLAADTYNHRVRRAAVRWDLELVGPQWPAR